MNEPVDELRARYLAKFSQMPEEERTLHLLLSLRFLVKLLEREVTTNVTPKQLGASDE